MSRELYLFTTSQKPVNLEMLYMNFRMSPIHDLLLHFLCIYSCYDRPQSLHMKTEAQNTKSSNKFSLKKSIHSSKILSWKVDILVLVYHPIFISHKISFKQYGHDWLQHMTEKNTQ